MSIGKPYIQQKNRNGEIIGKHCPGFEICEIICYYYVSFDGVVRLSVAVLYKGMRALKRIWDSIVKDRWIVLLDFLVVFVANFSALLIRFYVNAEIKPTVRYLVTDFMAFAPIYSVVCIIVFACFRLYGGMWKYAGINDMNRIIMASVVTTVLHYPISVIFSTKGRMPLSYYFIGALFQFLCVAAIRFGYRFLLSEKRKFINKRNPGLNSLVIGTGEAGRDTIKRMEENGAFRPVCSIDTKGTAYGLTLDGIPVVGGIDILDTAIIQYGIKVVFIADPLLQPKVKDEIARACERNRVQLKDYGYAFYLNGNETFVETREIVESKDTKQVIPFSPPDISDAEIGEVVEAMRSGWITTGPRTKLLERRLAAFIETGRADIDVDLEKERWSNRTVCLSSATAAEELNLRILGISPGDEVIVPAYTYTASASAAIHCGATVRFVDIQKDGDPVTGMPEMDYEKLEAAITEKTKAIIAVDLGGIVADYGRIFQIVEKKKNLFTPMESDGTLLSELSAKIQKGLGCVAIVADSAHALGGSRVVSRTGAGLLPAPEKRYCGRIAHFTSFSFHAVKNFTTAEGGASTWCLPDAVYRMGITDADIYRMYQLLSLHGQNKDALLKSNVGVWEYDIVGPWYKCNMTDIMAAIGLKQLDRYPGLLERRAAMIRKYDAFCDELGIRHLHHHTDCNDSSNHLYLIRVPGIGVDQRNRIIAEMAKAGVSTNVHYKPLPMMTAYKASGWDIRDFPNAEDYYRNLITLPLHTLLSDEDVDLVCETLRKVLKAC